MKKILLLMLLTWQMDTAVAQSWVYHPFPSDSLVWLTQWQHFDGSYTYEVKEMLGDTTVGSYTYKKLFASDPYMPSPSYSSATIFSYYGALRQDIPGKKVYIINTSGVEKLLYDFNLSVGDTAAIITTPTDDTILVTGIDSTLIGTSYHKSFSLSNTAAAAGMPSKLVEGMGNFAGLGNWYDYGFEYGYTLLCFSHQAVREYPIVTGGPWPYSCNLMVGISEISADAIGLDIFPNPSSDEINLRVSCQDLLRLEIRNELGQIVSKESNLEIGSRINISGLSPGIYFVRLSDSKGNSVIKKIVKE